MDWKFLKHEKNIGFVNTFFEGIKNTSEEFIFLCDQDDVWKENKIEHMYEKIKNNSDCLVLCSDFSLLYEDGAIPSRLIPYYLYVDVDGIRKLFPWIKYTMRVIRPGCGYCIRRELVEYYEKYHVKGEYHDAFFYRIAAVFNGLFFFPEKTMYWRRHSNNTSSRPIPFHQEIIHKREEYEVAHRNLKFYKENCFTGNKQEKLLKRMEIATKLRFEYYSNPILLNWIKMIPYFRYFENIFGIFWDFQWLFAKARRRND